MMIRDLITYRCVTLRVNINGFSVCTQLLVSRPDEENINCYLQLIEKCLTHEVNISSISVVQ